MSWKVLSKRVVKPDTVPITVDCLKVINKVCSSLLILDSSHLCYHFGRPLLMPGRIYEAFMPEGFELLVALLFLW